MDDLVPCPEELRHIADSSICSRSKDVGTEILAKMQKIRASTWYEEIYPKRIDNKLSPWAFYASIITNDITSIRWPNSRHQGSQC